MTIAFMYKRLWFKDSIQVVVCSCGEALEENQSFAVWKRKNFLKHRGKMVELSTSAGVFVSLSLCFNLFFSSSDKRVLLVCMAVCGRMVKWIQWEFCDHVAISEAINFWIAECCCFGVKFFEGTVCVRLLVLTVLEFWDLKGGFGSNQMIIELSCYRLYIQ